MMQTALLNTKTSIPINNAVLDYYDSWLDHTKASQLLDMCKRQLQWSQPAIRMFGKNHLMPRLTAWYGDSHCQYRYSGQTFDPIPWAPCLIELREKLLTDLGLNFNSVLANWYRNGQDSMSWHSDNEPELGLDPTIASISLGVTRDFRLRRRDDHSVTMALPLNHGSLLIMRGTTQAYWQHQIAKSRKIHCDRVNLTFRLIKSI